MPFPDDTGLAGVEVRFNDRVKRAEGVAVLATGPHRADVIAVGEAIELVDRSSGSREAGFRAGHVGHDGAEHCCQFICTVGIIGRTR